MSGLAALGYARASMGQGWTTVFTGEAAEAEFLRSRLEARGIPALIPDETVRTLNPTMVGGLLMFDRAVEVPDSAVLDARECLDEREEDSEMRAGEQELPADFFDAESGAEAELLARANLLSRRIRWSAILPIGVFFILFQIRPYLDVVARLNAKPALHRTTLAAALISPVYCAGALFLSFAPWFLN
ncbi:MAG TPA: hypothetical protein VK843_06815 [Planctomycetota bacterium]|nr:hypothetical protein [Planctomycetota bacterium]